ncbi:hypothetical protein ACTRXD_06030 [Nitrospira sp. T9]|uniref:hypothetical protein n=1 Tax=unclassified Nitrospira TaxID=2652172 RepID=UPI003F9D09E4
MYASQSLHTPLDQLFSFYRKQVVISLKPLVLEYYPDLFNQRQDEYRKMMELSAKMTVVGHACAEIAGFPYDARRQMIGSLFGGCCFLADSFIDDFGLDVANSYIDRMDDLLTKGWFEIQTDREKLFYVIIARLFAERDVLDPLLRQAILLLFQAQKRDVAFRSDPESIRSRPRREQLRILRESARNRSGHAILVLTGFLVPAVPLHYVSMIFLAGSLIMHIDDHGDCYSDLHYHRVTYLNQVADPERTLRRIFQGHIARLRQGLPEGSGRDLLIAFLTKYFATRLKKHRLQKTHRELAWAVYD